MQHLAQSQNLVYLKERSDSQSVRASELDRARALRFELEFAAVEKERKRIAKELHDEILPPLSRLVRTLNGGGEPTFQQILQELIADIRSMLGELHPVDLEELGLAQAIANIARRYSRLYRAEIYYKENFDSCPLSPLQQLSLYRAMQSLLQSICMDRANRERPLYVDYRLGAETQPQTQSRTVLISVGFCRGRESIAALLDTLPLKSLESFFDWCQLAGAQIGFNPQSEGTGYFDEELTERPYVLTISIEYGKEEVANLSAAASEESSLSRERLAELASIVDFAHEEWKATVLKDAPIFQPLAVSLERQRVLREIEKRFFPFFELLSNTVDQQMLEALAQIKSTLSQVVLAPYPQELADLDILSITQMLTARFKRTTLLPLRLMTYDHKAFHPALLELSSEKRLAIYRIMQESLHNIEKHAEASSVVILLEVFKDSLLICIEDNGVGLASTDGHESRGMRNIRERAAEISAKVCWQQSLSFAQGTLVSIEVPL